MGTVDVLNSRRCWLGSCILECNVSCDWCTPEPNQKECGNCRGEHFGDIVGNMRRIMGVR